MNRHHHITATLLVGALVVPSVAGAHGGDPLPDTIHDVDGRWVLVTNFGVVTEDSPAHYVCEEAFLGGGDFLVAPLSTTRWVTFSETSIMRTSDGCDFERVGDLGGAPEALDVSRDGTIVYVTNAAGADALGWTRDAADSFETLSLARFGDVQWTGVGLLDSGHAIVSGYSRAQGERGRAVLVRADLETLEATEPEGLEGTTYPYLLDVDGGRVAGLASDDDGLLLFWGDVGSPMWRARLESWPTDMHLSEGGERLLVGGATREGGGLEGRWPEGAPAPEVSELMSAHSADCVGVVDGEVYMCATRQREGHDLSHIDGERASEALRFEGLAGPDPRCGADSDVARTCGVVWPELAKALRIDPGEPAPEPPTLDEPPAGCQTAPESAEPSASMALVLLLSLCAYTLGSLAMGGDTRSAQG